MKICTIFAPQLHAVHYEQCDFRRFKVPPNEKGVGHELMRLLYLWTNARYLRYFFKTNHRYWRDDYWSGLGMDQFVCTVTESAPVILSDLCERAKKNSLDSLFEPLHKNQDWDEGFIEVKSKHNQIGGRRAIRLYAIRTENIGYIITGGILKISKEMKGHPLAELELQKLKYVKGCLEQDAKIQKSEEF